jgi:hypothetical protein
MKRTLVFAAAALALMAADLAAAGAQEGPDLRGDGSGLREAHWRGHDGGQRSGGRRGADMLRRLQAFDLNGDDAVTQAEIDQFRQGQIAAFDADADGMLSLEEYQALWLDAMRERMVDAFQEHDDDGDGLVTAEEFNERYAELVERFDRNGDGQLSADDRGGRAGRRKVPVQPEGVAPTPAPQ